MKNKVIDFFRNKKVVFMKKSHFGAKYCLTVREIYYEYYKGVTLIFQ